MPAHVAAAKKAAAPSKKRTTKPSVARAHKKEAELKAIQTWIEENDPLLDYAHDNPITVDSLFTEKLSHKFFTFPGKGELPYDWSVFREVLELRTPHSPRWFMQLREEDLLAGADGLEGVSVDCFVIAEASEPTMSPAEYVVKVHWPYSDAEDNAPERILSLREQDMCWRRVVKSNGSDINVFLLQKRADIGATAISSACFGFGAAPATTTTTAASITPANNGLNFGATTAAPANFGFGFGNTTSAAPASTTPGFSFGFGSTVPPGEAPNFNFGASALGPAPSSITAPSTGFSFGGASSAATPCDESVVPVQPLKASEILFCLWSPERLEEMVTDIISGSRIVREGLQLEANKTIKLVMQNDREDTVEETVRCLIMNRLFAKEDEDVKEVDDWISKCPVYDEDLASALQEFRERHVTELADASDLFESMYSKYQGVMTTELERIVEIRRKAAQHELDAIAKITANLKECKLSEKSSFRLLKYYAKNDIQKFRPFGKISGISEMGETVDVCEPPAHVNINPFTKQPM